MRVEPRRADDPFSAASMLDDRDEDDADDSDGPEAPYMPPKEGDVDDDAGRIKR